MAVRQSNIAHTCRHCRRTFHGLAALVQQRKAHCAIQRLRTHNTKTTNTPSSAHQHNTAHTSRPLLCMQVCMRRSGQQTRLHERFFVAPQLHPPKLLRRSKQQQHVRQRRVAGGSLHRAQRVEALGRSTRARWAQIQRSNYGIAGRCGIDARARPRTT
jgi:hypothetical protein